MKNKTVSSVVLIISFILIWAGSVQAEEIVVIVNANNPVEKLTMAEIKKYYENVLLKWPHGTKVTLYDLRVKDDIRKKFSQIVLGKDPRRVAMDWANKRITNTAKNPPRTLTSGILVQDKVSKEKAAMGYLLKSMVSNSNVKIVATVD